MCAASALMLTGCNDLLDISPRDTFTNSPAFWSNANQVESYSNAFYDNYIGYNTGSSYGWFYFTSLSDDQANPLFDNWYYTTIPNTSSEWSGSMKENGRAANVVGFKQVRKINYMIDGLRTANLDGAQKARFMAVARLNRAWAYYQLVRKYGNVQWENTVITDPEDEAVYGPRTDRDVVMDSVLADINYAAANLGASSDRTLWSKDMVLAMKSDICLYEGTFCKYRTQSDNGKAADATRAQAYLQEAAAAAEAVMNSNTYKLTPEYGTIYNQLDLAGNSEVIFYRHYDKDVVMHSLVDYTCSSTTQSGITKDAVDAFLFTDGKPKATTKLNTDDKAYKNAQGNYSIQQMLSRKDKRLGVLVDSIISFSGHGWVRNNPSPDGALPAEMTSSTGYTVRKFDNASLPLYYRTNTNTGYTDAPLYWYAVILLNYAEAKAELGTATQPDLDKSVNLLQARAGLPAMTLNPEADPANNMGVSSLIWEIRRSRRCELMCDNWYRYWDLVRWHQLDKLDSNKYPNINRGANVGTVSDLSGVAVDDAKYIIATKATRTFNPKYYQYPVPSNEIGLNSSITQNPGW